MVHSVAIFVILCFGTILAERRFRNAPIATSVKTGVNFDCPEEFGYYPHPSDCTQYYVCVFGGALLESCTGGLMYSHELQTCDWPRNVGCDGLDVSVSGAPASYSSYSPPARSKDRGREREKDKEREDTRPRYSAPPPPPPPLVQPAAVVTSRGQPRNLQQTQQEIIKRKQQQQLYVEAEEALPPAEEIESDRQQRVYRGQPSTIGQVQRDRDGLRHSNAISSYSGRGEKIGVISFGTQNQHYRLMTDDDLLLKYITPKRRQKRQIPKSRPPETTHHTRRQGNEKHFLDFIQFQPLTEQPRYTKRFSFNPSAPISNKEDDFHPFTPSYQKNSNNYQYIAFGKWADIPSRTSTIRYVNSYTTPNPASDKKRNRFPIKYNTSPVLVLQGDYSQTEAQKVPYVISHKPGNLQTQAIVAPYEVTTDSNENIQANTTEESSVEELEQFEPPPEFYKTENPYAHITNPFADPNFDFDEFLKRFQDLMTSTENSVVSTITSTESTTLKSKLSETTTSPSSHKHSGLNLIDLKVDENRKNENKRNNHRVHYTNTDLDKRYLGNDTRGNHPKNYSNILNINYIKENSSHQNVKPAKVEDPQQPKIHPVVDKTQVNDSSNDYYYYYDTYEDDPYPDKDGIRNNKDYIYYYDDEYYYPDFNSERKNSTSETVKSNEKVKVIVSDSKLNTQGSTVSPTVKVNLPYQKSRKTTLYRNTTTTPRPNRTTRRYSTRPTKRLVKRPEENVKQRIPFKELYDNETKSQRGEGFKSEEKPVSPQQASVSAVAAPARNIYNGSQYSDNRYEPYYSLYEDDVEIYRDEYPANENTYNNENSPSTAYRGTAPVSTVTPSSIRNEIPRRGNTVYIENNINPQDIYQQSTVSDYNENNNKYETQDDQNSYKQNNRQQSYRGDRNELNDVEEVATKRTTTKRTTTTTRKPSTTTRVTSTTTTIPPPKSSQPPQRTPSRGRGSVQYSGAGDQITNNEVIVTNNRGTPPTRSRPTLKPSTSIVSKAQEFVDVYKYPPTRPDPIYPQPQVDKTAAKCRKDVCLLPDCSCGGKDIPGNISVEEVPQIVLMTFDDAVNDLNKPYYIDIFESGRKNPNGCPISATFYVSHEWTDYSQVQNLYADGHEMASHTVSHSFGEQFSQKKWTREVAGQREILAAYGGVHLEDVRGMRAPFLSVGGNKMFKMLYDSNFTYDSSLPVYENKPPSWPYTLDYKLFHDCMIPPCPTRSYPGVWEVPMVMWQDLNGGRCSMGDACSNPPDADGVFKMLTKNFMRHYTTNRAPFGLFYHAAWFTQPHHKEGFINFIDSILAKNDVWFLTNWQAIQWVRDPTPMSRIGSFQPFQCNYQNRPKRCNNPKVCNLWHKSGVRYMRTCQPCPDIYPWTGNTGIRSSKIDNDIGD
ncbi:uncharacterized protein LOC114335194 isoform X4 [Diabrotica virgifera virgifera]|uniref:Chitin-binding type-2 domain-containing protein n=1 Tax=Diabrotica virgifera virgifera TaxID=50390 RepID=A0ABM5IT80_DIAVI|nr:uncharacterized protein LOC114335194 isoform X4 [Diabrotica virgifera virgifera]